MGKDTTIGHWEIAGVVSPKPLPTFPDGFPDSLIHEFEEKTGHKVLCNKPYSGTQVLKDYGEQAMKEDALIVYTSADSVFQVAANEELVPVHELYRYCEIAREMLKGEYGVGRVIARPFLGHTADTFYRTTNRHDLSLKPPRKTMLDLLKDAGRDVIAVGQNFRHLRRRGRDGKDQDHRQHQRHRFHQGFADPRLRGSGLREPRRFRYALRPPPRRGRLRRRRHRVRQVSLPTSSPGCGRATS